jgi:NADH-quinone oxidoreductase subunit N
LSALTRLFTMTFLLAALLATMFSREYLQREGLENGEFYALLMWGTVGMMMMAKGLDLLIVILGLETLSICIFVLVGYHRRIPISNEASLKYFLMGAFATGFILYGTALFYGASGSTSITGLATLFTSLESFNPLLTIAFIMLMAGFGFKLALAPFHGWAPDVYQGAPTPVAAWLSVAPKAATLIALMRIVATLIPSAQRESWTSIIAILAVLSMVIGNFVAIAQRDLKRMLAYSGIAHVGYMMIAMYVLGQEAVAAITIYALTYVLMNIGAFGVVSLLNKNQNDPQSLGDIAGLGFRRPFYGLALTIFMLSLAGIPPTAGFISKVYVFKVAIEAGAVMIALIGILTSIVSVYYYLRVVYYLYMKEATDLTPVTEGGIFATGALLISIVGILAIGIFPGPLFDTAVYAASTLMGIR